MKPATKMRAEKFYELKSNGMAMEEIASRYFLSVSRVKQVIADYEREREIPKAHSAKARAKPTTHKAKAQAETRAVEYRELRQKGATLEDIASTYGLSRQRIDQIIKRYERQYNLPSSTDISKELAQKARRADIEEHKLWQSHVKRLNYKRFVPSFQIDAHLVDRFLVLLGKKAVLYGFDGKAKSNPKRRKDGTPYPGNSKPTNIFISGVTSTNRRHIKVHTWVLEQYEIRLEEGQHCHHIDGDITNNMLENLQVLSNVEHGRLTQQELRKRVSRIEQISLDFDT